MKLEEKKELAFKIGEEIKKYKTIVIFDLYKLPNKEFKEIRKELSKKGKIIVTKKSIFFFALKNAGIPEDIFKSLELRQFGLFLTNEEPFSIYKYIYQLKTERFAKENDVAQNDIWIYAGPTQIKAGPSVSEFARLKIPVGVEGGFIGIKKDTQIVKKGDKITKEIASILRKLKIKPILVNLDVIAIFHENTIYKKEILNLVFEYLELIKKAYCYAFNLTTNINYPTKENINILISKAYLKARTLENLVIKNE
ncbi:MAG: 50S ribosomal protein L10 [Candidatus Aenigmatarchaeota archaeon]